MLRISKIVSPVFLRDVFWPLIFMIAYDFLCWETGKHLNVYYTDNRIRV